ncbi:MAG: DUF4276 family protein [Verrucomicrobiae bacterium]|nr:DUF4276 family protein [Verrucomicrobiae bacterium]
MAGLVIVTIVEGHGEVKALPILLRRLVAELAPQAIYEIPPPIRIARSSFLNRENERERTIKLASLKGGNPKSSMILLLFDADDDCPAEKVPELLQMSRDVRDDFPMALTLAKSEYEAWFLAAAESLRGKRSLPPDLERPADPESVRDAKGWIKRNRSDQIYSETLDQAAYSALFDFTEARTHSPSFDKFCRDFERLIAPFI